jgi:hypothetical protein
MTAPPERALARACRGRCAGRLTAKGVEVGQCQYDIRPASVPGRGPVRGVPLAEGEADQLTTVVGAVSINALFWALNLTPVSDDRGS